MRAATSNATYFVPLARKKLKWMVSHSIGSCCYLALLLLLPFEDQKVKGQKEKKGCSKKCKDQKWFSALLTTTSGVQLTRTVHLHMCTLASGARPRQHVPCCTFSGVHRCR